MNFFHEQLKLKKLIEKKPKITKKINKMCAPFELETNFQALQNTGTIFRELQFKVSSNKNFFFTKIKIAS